MTIPNAGDVVILRKMSPSPKPLFPTASVETYIPGIVNEGVTLPIKYELEGLLQEPIEVGKPVRIVRFRRNEVIALGEIETSVITSIKQNKNGWLLQTINSVYEISKSDVKLPQQT